MEREAVGVYESQKSATERRSIYLITLCLSLFFWGVTSVTSFFSLVLCKQNVSWSPQQVVPKTFYRFLQN